MTRQFIQMVALNSVVYESLSDLLKLSIRLSQEREKYLQENRIQTNEISIMKKLVRNMQKS